MRARSCPTCRSIGQPLRIPGTGLPGEWCADGWHNGGVTAAGTHYSKVYLDTGTPKDTGRGANWVLKITLPKPFSGERIDYSQDGRTAVVTVPFSNERSALDAASCVKVEVVPGENHVIQGIVDEGTIDELMLPEEDQPWRGGGEEPGG